MDLDFLEIGTSNFDTLIQSSENEVGISVEPISHYLNALPIKPNVIKVHAAITSDKTSNSVDVYNIPEDVIDANNLAPWLKGCNSIGNYHNQHIEQKIENLVRIEKVPLLNIEELLIIINIRRIKYLKIDTEGHDCVILKGLFKYLKDKPKEYYPEKINFESNSLTPADIINEIIIIAKFLGYKLIHQDCDNTTLIYS